jgi:hypothetical protein
MIYLATPIVALAVSLSVPNAATQGTRASKAGKHCLSDYAKKRFGHLRFDAESSKVFETKLFAAYLLYRQAPDKNRRAFIRALPTNKDQFIRYSQIPYTLNPTPFAESSEIRDPSVPWPLNFWDIQKEIFKLALEGESTAISTMFGLTAYGDGEFAEGQGEDCFQLFLHPDLVASHWALFESHVAFLSELNHELNSEEILALRNRYIIVFKNNPDGLKAIFYAIDHSLR